MSFRIDQLAVLNLATVGNSVTAGSFVKSGGTSSQFLKADGSVDSNTYLTSGSFLPLSGGTMTGQIYAPSIGTGTYDGAIQIREYGYVGSGQSAWGYAPAITFHWGNRSAQKFGLRADGLFAIDDEPLALRSWVTSQGYVTGGPYLPLSGGTLTGNLTVNAGGSYSIQASSTQRYIIQARNTSNSVNSGYGWWWFHNTNGDMGFHADGIGDILNLTRAGVATLNGNVVWHAGNDGSGSGLDADMVDGYHLNQDVRTSAAPSFQYIGVNPSGASNNGFGISLYGGASAGPTYGIFFQGTGTYGTHGSVTGDWATYFTMNNDNSRGWIWRKAATGNIASLSASGVLQVDDSMRAPIFYDSDNTSYYLDPAGSTSGYFAGVLRQNVGKYVRDSSYRTYSGASDYYSGGSAGWYTVAQITLTSNCSGAVLYGTLYDHRYDGADTYQIAVVARADCEFTSNNEAHYINVGCTILGSTNYTDYRSKIRVILSASSSGSRTYELQFYESPWNSDTWQLESNGWTIYTSPQAPSSGTGTARVNYISNQSADYQRANTAMYSPIYYDSNDTTYYLDPNSSSRLRYLYVGDGGSNWSNPGGWDTTLYVSGVNHAIIRVENRQNNYHSTLHSHTGQLPGVGSPGDYDYRITRNWSNRMIFYTNYTYAYGYLEAEASLRAPIFYDSNNTSYYLDPSATGTSLYVAGSVQGSYYVASNYSSTGYTQYKGYDNNNHFIMIRGRVTGNTTTPTYTGYHRTSLVEYAEANDDTGWFFQTAATGNYDIVARITRSYSQFEGSVRAPIFYDSENTSYYGDFAGTSNLNVLAANSIYTGGGLSTNGGNSLLGVQSPGGASRANGGSTETGAFKITLPSGIPVYGMFKLVIHIYEYGQRGNGYEIHCGGHMYPNYMYNRFQVQYGTANAPLNVRYGNDGTNGCIWIGDTNTTWSYPQIWVSEFMMGYSNTSWTTWRSGWSISLVTSYGNSGAMDGPYTCEYGYAASAGSASTSSQVSINYNNDSNSTYQLLWGSGNSVYGTAGVYVNPYDDRVYANYFSSAYYMDVYTSAGGDYLRITDNQVYRPGGGGLYLNWSSNANVFITGSGGGNVGVGNNSPSYKMHVSGDIYANGGWLRVSGSSGLYFESYGGGWHMTESSYIRSYNSKSLHMNGASVDYVGSLYFSGAGHIQPNAGSYGALQMTSTRGGWAGIRFTDTENNLMMNSNESGHHRNGYGWQFRWYDGTLYCSKNSQGGGTEATVLDSSNYTSWAAPRAYVHSSYVDFYIYGDQNTYYPVTIHNWNNSHGFQRYSIHRGYSWTAPWDPIGTGSHRGGLTFTFDWAGDIAWGGNDKSIRVIEFDETYTSMVAGMQLAHCEGVVVWLRGGGAGGAHYRLHGPGGLSQTYSINMSSWTSCAGVTYSPRSHDGGTVNSEIRSRYPVRGSGSGDIYVNNQAVIHSGNIGSQSVSYASSAGNADTVDSYHASNFLGYFGNSYYQANTWIQLNGVHGLYAPSYNGAHWMPNTNSTYTTWRIAGSRNGYSGIHDDHSSVQMVMFDGSGNGGTYREANSRWYWYYHLSNDCMGIGTSSTNSSYSIYSNKGHGVYYSGNNAAGFDAIHSGSINGGSTVQGLTLQWQGYGATYVIAYKQGELSPSDMAHVYSVGGFYFKIFDGSSNRFHRWDDNGSVSINSSSQGSYIFNVTGDIYATADVIAFSDARVKEDVRTVENALDKVTKLRGVTYIKKDEENKKRKMGVIAQEVLEVLPEVVHEDNDGYYGVSYGNIVGVLIEAIKEQQKQIDELKQELKNK